MAAIAGTNPKKKTLALSYRFLLQEDRRIRT